MLSILLSCVLGARILANKQTEIPAFLDFIFQRQEMNENPMYETGCIHLSVQKEQVGWYIVW